ncbi:MAG: DNA/RNA nuclease SfsA, partial [Syntrophorhabdus sp.]|nr:DNA/RNA nuclease SfsA [Syntrophorhabdus sp.]
MSLIKPLRLFKKPFQATFVSRPNRFLVECVLNENHVQAFLPNPGRLQELLLPGATLYLNEESSTPLRKTSLTVIAVEREGVPVMLHTHRTNQVARYLIENGFIQNL